jgi:uncharacterized protein YbjT (DUF2867 family)
LSPKRKSCEKSKERTKRKEEKSETKSTDKRRKMAEELLNQAEKKAEELAHLVGGSLIKIGEALGIPNPDPHAGLILITGGQGIIDHRVLTRLQGYPYIRLASHNSDRVADLNKKGVQVADFAWDRPDTFGPALVGVKSVLCTIPYTENWKDNFLPFLEACKRAGVKHFVKLSFYHARKHDDPFQNVPLVKAHGTCDDSLVLSGIPYTILAATHFMSNPFMFQGKELRAENTPAVMYGASKEKRINYISPNDVADCAVRVLLEPNKHFKKEYTLTGPISISDQLVATYLSVYLKKQVVYVEQPLQEFKENEQSHGNPKWLVDDLTSLEQLKASGLEEDPKFATKDVELICGHRAETFESYLRRTHFMTPIEMA